MESKPRLKIPFFRISRAGEKDSSIDATAFTKMGASRQKKTLDARDRFNRGFRRYAKKSEPLFWWLSQKHRTICFGVSFLQVYYTERLVSQKCYLSISESWGPKQCWYGRVWSGIAQWRLRVPNRLWKSSDRLVSQAQWAEKHFHYGHRERGGTVAISNYPLNESLSFHDLVSPNSRIRFAFT